MSTTNYLRWKNIELQQLERLNFGDSTGQAIPCSLLQRSLPC